MKYDMIDNDFYGCDPVIAEALRCGKQIKCMCGGLIHGVPVWVYAHNKNSSHKYITNLGAFKEAIPIEKKRKAKTFVEIAKWLEDNNYVCNGKGEWEWVSNGHCKMPIYPMYLFCYCGREIPEGVFFPEEWLV